VAKPFYNSTDAELGSGASNAVTIITPVPATYGTTAGFMTSYTTLTTNYNSALALATGLRMSNITGLQWSWIDLERRHVLIPGIVMKNGQPHPLPLNETAIGVLTRITSGWKHPTHVFTFKKKPFRRANASGWKEALKRAGIANFRFHDLRHTWASWII